MANELDEMNPVVNEAGRDVNVIEKQLPVKTGVGSVIFEICLWLHPRHGTSTTSMAIMVS